MLPDPDPAQQLPLRPRADHDSHRQRRPGAARTAAALGDRDRSATSCSCIGPISSLFDLLTFCGAAARVPCLGGALPDGLVRGVAGDADAGALRDPDRGEPWPQPTEPAAGGDDVFIVLIGLMIPFTPLAPMLGFVPLPGAYFLFLAVARADVLAAGGTGETPAHGPDARVSHTNRQSVHIRTICRQALSCPTAGMTELLEMQEPSSYRSGWHCPC